MFCAQLEFDSGTNLAGASVQTYLLEKSRVVYQGPGERNFHVFYHVFESSSVDSSAWQLLPKEQYHYINQSGVYGAAMVDDKGGENGVDAVVKSLLAVTDGEAEYIAEVYSLIAAILWLGNVEFSGDGAGVVDTVPLGHAARLFGCAAEDLAFALTHSSKEIAGEQIASELSPLDAQASRDSLARNMYGRLFDDVVSRLNTSLRGDAEDVSISHMRAAAKHTTLIFAIQNCPMY